MKLIMLLERSGTKHSGALISLWLKPAAAKRLEQDDGEDAKDMHITLCYIKDGSSLGRDKRAVIRSICRELADEHGPFQGTITGAGRFEATKHSDGHEVIYARPTIAGLKQFREKLSKRLKEEGINVSNNFSYKPHITLMYQDDEEEQLPELPKVPLKFHELSLSFGDRREAIKFGG